MIFHLLCTVRSQNKSQKMDYIIILKDQTNLHSKSYSNTCTFNTTYIVKCCVIPARLYGYSYMSYVLVPSGGHAQPHTEQPPSYTNRPPTNTHRYSFPYGPDLYGFAFQDTTITEVIPGTTAHRVGLVTGGQILEINGKPTSQLTSRLNDIFSSIRQNCQDLHLLVKYPEPADRLMQDPLQRHAPHNLQGIVTQIPASTRHRPTRRHYYGNRRPWRDMSESWGQNMLMSQSEARMLDLWSAVSFLCFCPVGTLAVCFVVMAENADTQEDMQKHRTRAYVTNVLANVLGVILTIVLVATLAF